MGETAALLKVHRCLDCPEQRASSRLSLSLTDCRPAALRSAAPGLADQTVALKHRATLRFLLKISCVYLGKEFLREKHRN